MFRMVRASIWYTLKARVALACTVINMSLVIAPSKGLLPGGAGK